jgi:hypothetical protein
MSRLDDLKRFYELVAALGPPAPAAAFMSGRPRDGIYLFFEAGETRTDSGDGPRVVRVEARGWSLLERAGHRFGSGPKLATERSLEAMVTDALHENGVPICVMWAPTVRPVPAQPKVTARRRHLMGMDVIRFDVRDGLRRGLRRAALASNIVGLLSNFDRPPLDAASKAWLGRCSARLGFRWAKLTFPRCGLWNEIGVKETYDPAFLDELADAVSRRSRAPEARTLAPERRRA